MKSSLKIIRFKKSWIFVLSILLVVFSCKTPESTKTESQKPARNVVVPNFNADSAYYYVQEQVDFGPRIPNTQAHRNAGDRIIARLNAYDAKISIQQFRATTYDGVELELRNVMGSYNPEKRKRILLATHWDTRPWASKEKEDPTVEFDGANDGGSGVGVLLEIARQIQMKGG
ncbi:MAG: M28 family peptidase, partial [Bacteroidota bacterium]